MSAPLFVAEVVSPGNEASDNYLRDYVWKRQQYQDWQIPEYWIIDPHQTKVTVLSLSSGHYQEKAYKKGETIASPTFTSLQLSVDALLSTNA